MENETDWQCQRITDTPSFLRAHGLVLCPTSLQSSCFSHPPAGIRSRAQTMTPFYESKGKLCDDKWQRGGCHTGHTCWGLVFYSTQILDYKTCQASRPHREHLSISNSHPQMKKTADCFKNVKAGKRDGLKSRPFTGRETDTQSQTEFGPPDIPRPLRNLGGSR